jgi:hypothetical protein
MKYELKSNEILRRLSGDLGLTDEIAIMRWTVQDLISMFEIQQGTGRLAIGAMLREAIEQISRVTERASRLPQDNDTVPVARVVGMLRNIETAIGNQLPDGAPRQQLIMSLKELLEGISIGGSDEPGARILRTVDMMDRSVPRLDNVNYDE